MSPDFGRFNFQNFDITLVKNSIDGAKRDPELLLMRKTT